MGTWTTVTPRALLRRRSFQQRIGSTADPLLPTTDPCDSPRSSPQPALHKGSEDVSQQLAGIKGNSEPERRVSPTMNKSASERKPGGMRPETIRLAVLLTLVIQNSAEAIFMRCSFKPQEVDAEGEGGERPQPASSTAVVMAEVCKLVCSLLLQRKNDGSTQQLMSTLREDIWLRPLDVIKMAVPACLYVIQNNLKYVAISNLDGPTFQLLYQLKILTTAVFSVVMLKRALGSRQWAALAMLALGVGLVQISGTKPEEGNPSEDGASSGSSSSVENAMLGFAAVLLACCSSGFAGVYFEKVLKGTSTSLWVRNMQLSAFSILLGAVCVWEKDGESVDQNGFFYGYSFSVWMAVLLNSFGGLVVAMVVKYADNVIKGFATSMSIVLTAVVSFLLFEFSITVMFAVGAYCVLHSTFLYSFNPAPPTNLELTINSSDDARVDELEVAEKAGLLRFENTPTPTRA